jgi:3-methyladenine DNA glycosylase/8-oxoguanine DNA glycosylase
MTPAEYQKARLLLMRRDPVLGAAIKRIGALRPRRQQRNDHLTALVGAIVSQQLSTKRPRRSFGGSSRSFQTAKSRMRRAIMRYETNNVRASA